MSKQGDTVYSCCGEVFNYDTPDFDIGDTFYEGITQEIKVSDLVSDYTVDVILEQMDEALFEEVGDLAEDNLHLNEEDKEELLDLIKGFIDIKAKVTCFKVVDIEEKVMEE